MKLSAPKVTTFGVAVILGILGLLGKITPIPVVSDYSFWLVVIGFLLLMLGSFLKGL